MNLYILFILLLLSVSKVQSAVVPITQSNIKSAVNEWCTDRASALAKYGHITDWDTSEVTDMSYLFYGKVDFNDPLNWNTENVTNMYAMFDGATSFNQPLNGWDVSNVTDMFAMFHTATSFNQQLNGWDVSNVTDMFAMFHTATSFNQQLNGWDVSKVTYMSQMFNGATSFNQPLNDWDVGNVTPDMDFMFANAEKFNQQLNGWNVSNVNTMRYMFYGALSFNQPLNDWGISNVTDMYSMFRGATSFNQPLNGWGVSKVTTMEYMFYEATSFNQQLCWDTNQNTNHAFMFDGTLNSKLLKYPNCATLKPSAPPSQSPSIRTLKPTVQIKNSASGGKWCMTVKGANVLINKCSSTNAFQKFTISNDIGLIRLKMNQAKCIKKVKNTIKVRPCAATNIAFKWTIQSSNGPFYWTKGHLKQNVAVVGDSLGGGKSLVLVAFDKNAITHRWRAVKI